MLPTSPKVNGTGVATALDKIIWRLWISIIQTLQIAYTVMVLIIAVSQIYYMQLRLTLWHAMPLITLLTIVHARMWPTQRLRPGHIVVIAPTKMDLPFLIRPTLHSTQAPVLAIVLQTAPVVIKLTHSMTHSVLLLTKYHSTHQLTMLPIVLTPMSTM